MSWGPGLAASATSGSPRPPAGWPSGPRSASSPARSGPASEPAWRRPPTPPATGSSRPEARTAPPMTRTGPRPAGRRPPDGRCRGPAGHPWPRPDRQPARTTAEQGRHHPRPARRRREAGPAAGHRGRSQHRPGPVGTAAAVDPSADPVQAPADTDADRRPDDCSGALSGQPPGPAVDDDLGDLGHRSPRRPSCRPHALVGDVRRDALAAHQHALGLLDQDAVVKGPLELLDEPALELGGERAAKQGTGQPPVDLGRVALAVVPLVRLGQVEVEAANGALGHLDRHAQHRVDAVVAQHPGQLGPALLGGGVRDQLEAAALERLHAGALAEPLLGRLQDLGAWVGGRHPAQHLALADQHQPGPVSPEQRLGRVDDLLHGRLQAPLPEPEVLQRPDALEERFDVDALLDLHPCAAHGVHSCPPPLPRPRQPTSGRRSSGSRIRVMENPTTSQYRETSLELVGRSEPTCPTSTPSVAGKAVPWLTATATESAGSTPSTWTTRPASPSGPRSTPACSAPSPASSPSPRPPRPTTTSASPTTSSWSTTPPGSTPTSTCRRPRSDSCGATTAWTTTAPPGGPRPAERQWGGTPRGRRLMRL